MFAIFVQRFTLTRFVNDNDQRLASFSSNRLNSAEPRSACCELGLEGGRIVLGSLLNKSIESAKR